MAIHLDVETVLDQDQIAAVAAQIRAVVRQAFRDGIADAITDITQGHGYIRGDAFYVDADGARHKLRFDQT